MGIALSQVAGAPIAAGEFPMWWWLGGTLSNSVLQMPADGWAPTSTHAFFSGLLALDGMLGLRGWQLLFLFEGLPTILMGIYIACSLAESPAKVHLSLCIMKLTSCLLQPC